MVIDAKRLEEIIEPENLDKIDILKSSLSKNSDVGQFWEDYKRQLTDGFGAGLDQVIHPLFKKIYQSHSEIRESTIKNIQQEFPQLTYEDGDEYLRNMAQSPECLSRKKFVYEKSKLTEEQVEPLAEFARGLIYKTILDYVTKKTPEEKFRELNVFSDEVDLYVKLFSDIERFQDLHKYNLGGVSHHQAVYVVFNKIVERKQDILDDAVRELGNLGLNEDYIKGYFSFAREPSLVHSKMWDDEHDGIPATDKRYDSDARDKFEQVAHIFAIKKIKEYLGVSKANHNIT
jgi:hypothetical protein